MSFRWKRSSVLLAVTAAVAVVAASVASAKTSVGPASTAKQQSTLSIMGFGKGDDVAQSRFAIAAKAVGGGIDNPNGGFNDQQFLAAVASGNVPDLVYMDRQKLGTYAAKGALVPLTSCIKSQKIDMSQYRIPAVNEVTYNKQVYGIPEFYTVRTIIVDNNVLDQTHTPIGWLNPAKPSLLLKAAKQMAIVQNGKVTRIGFDPKIEAFFPLWAKAYGVDILSKDGLHAHLNDPRAVKALTYAMSLINAQGGWNAFISFRNTWDFFGGKQCPRGGDRRSQERQHRHRDHVHSGRTAGEQCAGATRSKNGQGFEHPVGRKERYPIGQRHASGRWYLSGGGKACAITSRAVSQVSKARPGAPGFCTDV